MIELQGFFDTDTDITKTSFSVFVAILYIKVLYILVMTLYVLSRYNEIVSWILNFENDWQRGKWNMLSFYRVIILSFYCNRIVPCKDQENYPIPMKRKLKFQQIKWSIWKIMICWPYISFIKTIEKMYVN